MANRVTVRSAPLCLNGYEETDVTQEIDRLQVACSWHTVKKNDTIIDWRTEEEEDNKSAQSCQLREISVKLYIFWVSSFVLTSTKRLRMQWRIVMIFEGLLFFFFLFINLVYRHYLYTCAQRFHFLTWFSLRLLDFDLYFIPISAKPHCLTL